MEPTAPVPAPSATKTHSDGPLTDPSCPWILLHVELPLLVHVHVHVVLLVHVGVLLLVHVGVLVLVGVLVHVHVPFV
jgi:hypothetical protein